MAFEELFKSTLKIHRMNMGPGNRSKTKEFSTTKQILYPYQYERAYFKEISRIQKSFLDPLTKIISEQLPGWISEFKVDSSLKRDSYINIDQIIESNNLKLDGFSEDYQELLQEEQQQVEETYVEQAEILLLFLNTLGSNIATFNDRQNQKHFKQLLGTTWTVPEPWLDEVINTWALTNFDLIRSLTVEGIAKVNFIVSQGIQFGETYSEIMAKIRKSNKNITQARSRLLARDQVGKLNGQLTKRRMQEAGVLLYIWATVKDERVRGNPNGKYPGAIPSHFIMDGKLCRWDDNNVYSLDNGKTWIPRPLKAPRAVPGQEIQCRCTGLGYFNDIINEIDNEIEEELVA